MQLLRYGCPYREEIKVMAKGNIWVPVAAIVVIAAIASMYLGITGQLFGLAYASAVLFGVAIVALLKGMKVKAFKAMPPANDMHAIYLGVILLIVLFAMGALTPMFSKFGISAGAASLTPVGAVTPGASSTANAVQACQQKVAAANGNLVGSSATVTINGYDMESNTPYSSTVGAGVYVFKNGAYVGQYTTAAGSVTGVTIGDIVDIYGLSNSSYYVDDSLGNCITGAQNPITMTAHATVSKTGMQITCYAADGTVLNAGSASVADYNVTQGASQQTQISCKLAENTANKAFWLRGIATGVTNYSKQAIVLDSQWSAVSVPSFLATSVVEARNSSVNVNVSNGYQKLFEVASPIKLAQWQSVVTNFRLDAQTTDPAFALVDFLSVSNLPSLYFIQYLDQGSGRDLTGAIYNDVATHDTAQTNLGLAEDVFLPQGKYTGVTINAI